jgi:DNA-binding XRE family transcriptional regulator
VRAFKVKKVRGRDEEGWVVATLARVTEAADELTQSAVAEILGVSPSTVARIDPDRLPYRTTPGGASRKGRRIYRRVDVERLAAELSSTDRQTRGRPPTPRREGASGSPD